MEKKIHYCWFGGNELSKSTLECIESWKKFFPDYEIIEWNENNFNVQEELKRNRFFRECYNRKLWAFVSDYIRIKVLYNYGGIYLDTDMEIVKKLDNLLDTDMFLGYENEDTMSFGIVGVKPKHKVFEKMYNFYQDEIWKSPLHIITSIFTEILVEEYDGKYEENNIKIYPREYFYPFNHDEEFTPKCTTENTYAIHWWGKSWKKNPKVYFLKYKHLPFWKKYPKHISKLINYYFKNLFNFRKG